MKIEGASVTTKNQLSPKLREENHEKQLQQSYQIEQRKFTKDDLQKKVDGINKFLKSSNTNLKFNLHEELKEYYVTIIDEETKEVVKEVPPKKLLDIYAAMKEALGLFIDKKI